MTLLDEYQALPGEPAHPDFNRQRVLRRDAIVRLLCRALRESADALDRTYDAQEWPADGSSNAEVARDKMRALLTAVERDFPEGA